MVITWTFRKYDIPSDFKFHSLSFAPAVGSILFGFHFSYRKAHLWFSRDFSNSFNLLALLQGLAVDVSAVESVSHSGFSDSQKRGKKDILKEKSRDQRNMLRFQTSHCVHYFFQIVFFLACFTNVFLSQYSRTLHSALQLVFSLNHFLVYQTNITWGKNPDAGMLKSWFVSGLKNK